jgi:hypothetical protein
VSTLVQGGDDDVGAGMAQRLSKKLGFMAFVSCTLPGTPDYMPLLAQVERRVLEAVKAH